MKKNYLAFIVTHGNLGECIKNVSENLIASTSELFYYSNQTQSLDSLADEINKKIEEYQPRKIIFFVDLMGGSCWALGNRLKKKNARTFSW